jgi:integrase
MTRRFHTITRDAIKRLATGASLTEGGITAQKLVDGDTRWSINVMVSGARIHRVIGRESEGVTRADAENFIEQARVDERAGRLNLPTKRKTHLSFAELCDRYLVRQEAIGGKNLAAKREQISAKLKPAFGKTRADALTEFTIKSHIKRRLEKGAAPGTINRELATLKHLLRDAVKAKDLKAMPCQVDMLSEPPGRIVVLSNEDCDKLLQSAILASDPDLWVFVATGLNTAMRHREMLRMRWDQIDWTRQRVFVPVAKAGMREQPMTPQLIEMLTQERAQRDPAEEWVFPNRKSATRVLPYRDAVSDGFRRAVIRAGLDPKEVTPHVMRHTAITRLVEAGVDLPTIQRISGHKTLAMVLRYTHVHGTHINEAIAKIGRGLPSMEARVTANVTRLANKSA